MAPPNEETLRQNLALEGPAGWYVAEVGVIYASAELTDRERRIVNGAMGRKKFRMKQCFWNAQRLVLADKTKTLKYVEGFRCQDDGCTLHAWASINGKVIDPTTLDSDAGEGVLKLLMIGFLPPSSGTVLGVFDEKKTAYIGVQLSRRDLQRREGDTVLDDWKHSWPIIRRYEKRTGRCSPTYQLKKAK